MVKTKSHIQYLGFLLFIFLCHVRKWKINELINCCVFPDQAVLSGFVIPKKKKGKDKTCTIGYLWMSVRLQSTINCRLSPEVIEWALSTQKALTLISLLFYCQILSTSWHLFQSRSVSPGRADQFITSQLTHPALPLSPPLSSHSSVIHHDN